MGGKPQGSRLASCILAVTGSELASGVVPGLQWEQIRGSKGLVSANVNICGAKADEIFRASSAALLAFGSFFSDKSFWVYL